MRFDWSSLFLFAAIVNIFLTLSFALLSGKFQDNKKRRFWFIVLETSIFIILFEGIIRNSGLIDQFPYLLFISTPILFIIQPALLLYQRSIRGEKKRVWPHFIITFLNILIMIPTFRMSSSDKLAMFKEENIQDPIWIIAFYVVYFAFYQFLIFRTHIGSSKDLESEYSKNTLEWQRLSSFTVAISGFALFAIPLLLMAQYFSIPQETISSIRKGSIVAFSMIGHVLMFSMLLTTEEKRVLTDKKKTAPLNEDYESKKLELLSFMSTNKAFLDNDLTLNSLAKQINWSRSLLSAVINRSLGQNFYDFINTQRLEELKLRIHNQEHKTYSLDHLVQQCGFTNYVSFYRFVKRTLNTSPSSFVKEIEATK